ncbi:dihydrodipicolinate synthase family protein [Pullulanibacillus sp. KACC 23026]|uniref:dihydrodipicolinate synthase family protein n=1 Tax=Pullulanibacillus sp. KACC 23026 TaxID=3028315 RepID=UPI0023AECAF8|nr:dihydrodipicolinate synthase family protein [Pullulanibacillus sp. KACC 23026]WEG13688.1 dihydrodipicolinate synthase family protein [Pullulanibacillus sp. KACC 23026]
MSNTLILPSSKGNLLTYKPIKHSLPETLKAPSKSRIAYAAAHVVADPLVDLDLSSETVLDWEKTLAYRRYLWSLGFNVAEAMDTAQRGMGLNWEATKELIQRSVAEAKAYNGGIACGAGTDQLVLSPSTTLDAIIQAYTEQCEFIEEQGGHIILMASQALAAVAKSPEDYASVYGKVLSQVSKPVILHWLGDMFDPKLQGYWGTANIQEAMALCLDVIKENQSKIKGIKISLLDAELEIQMRKQLPEGVNMYTGDDFNYPDLIKGDGDNYSHALLGIFDAIAPLASSALKYLDEGNVQKFEEILAPTVPLSRHIFKAPTRFYKTGVVFLAYLNGHQDHFRMVGGLESMRSVVHLSELFVLADKAGLLQDPDKAIGRMKQVLSLAGVN